MTDGVNYSSLVNKPPIDEILQYDLVNKPDLDEIVHYGVKGMHWGVRRYQNADGSLTPLGKKRRNGDSDNRGDGEMYDTGAHDRSKKMTYADKRKKIIEKRMERDAKREIIKKYKEKKKREKILQDPKKILKYQHMFSNEEIQKAKERILLLQDIKDLKTTKLRKGQDYANQLIKSANTLNEVLKFLNSNAGKGIRQTLGLSTDDWWNFNPQKNNDDKDKK